MYLCTNCIRPARRLAISGRRFISSNNHEILKNIFSDENKQKTVARAEALVSTYERTFKVKKTAAVLVALCHVNNEPCLLLTVRSRKLASHTGDVSFPGGAVDYGDPSVIHTALRETEEEIGFPSSEVDVWTTLVPAPDKKVTTAVHPVVGYLGHVNIPQLLPNPNEVERIFAVPISILLSKQARTRFRVNHHMPGAMDYSLPVFLSQPRVWGLTALFIDMLLAVLIPECHSLQIPVKRVLIKKKYK